MIKNTRKIQEFERAELKKEKLSFREAAKVFELMWKEALSLGAAKGKFKTRDVAIEIRLAKLINAL
jgi:hypothetical protein